MTEFPYSKLPSADLDALLDAALQWMGAEIDSLKLPKLAAVVLGGGYGRGEGGICRTPQGDRPYNDLDLFVFSAGADRGEMRRIAEKLAERAAVWEKRLGVAVDLSPVKELRSLQRVANKLMYQELVRGWRPIWGTVDLKTLIPLRPPEELPFSEAVRLILNRGMGLIFAGEHIARGNDDGDFIMRNMHKSQLGGGDALLIAAGKYHWRSEERLAALREYVSSAQLPERIAENYERALQYKMAPVPVLPADPGAMWQECRECFLGAARHVAGCAPEADAAEVLRGFHRRAAAERSLRNFLRWQLRGGVFRSPAALFDPPEVTVAGMLYRLIAENPRYPACPQRLYRLWCKFN